ncbi:SpvB/TcaC N-terminal domain-containing protein [Nocardia aurea]|uniref:SpvB/TcaC N-terminal domain-containing protein n=1 Tax=Nocardia aurea TaxID=2144174 RepID=A0ABV3G4T6_9NOCA
MGEVLEPVSLHGTLGFRVPLSMTPGRGLEPDLVLAYTSGAANSSFGHGWDLPLASIARQTDRGLPRYASDDGFVLVGKDELVQVGIPDQDPAPFGGYGELTFRTVYRPRTEGSYVRVERHTRVVTGEVFWVTFSPANVLTIFGRSAAARVADPHDTDHVFSWLPEDIYDDRGNHLHYHWVADDIRGVHMAAPGEAHRAPEEFAQRYLRDIAYLNTIPVADRFADTEVDHTDPQWRDRFGVVVVLDYGDYPGFAGVGPTPGIEPTGEWDWRADRFSTRRPGFEVRTQRLCRRLLTFHHFPDELGQDWLPVSATELLYERDPSAARLIEITHVGFESDGTALRMPPLRFSYQSWTPAAGPVPLSGGGFPVGLDDQWIDLDADGAPGILHTDGSTWYYRSNLGEGMFAPVRTETEVPATRPDDAPEVAAVFGDGRLAVTARDGTVRYAVRDAATQRWQGWRPFLNSPVIDWSDAQLRQVDLDGDGLTDLLVNEGDTLSWHRFTGAEGWETRREASAGADETRGPRVRFGARDEAALFADMTGDGLDDLVRVRGCGAVCYWPNLGYGRFGPQVTMAGAPTLDLLGEFEPARVRLIDVDGTGPADLLYIGATGVSCWRNELGNAWSAATELASVIAPTSTVEVRVLDLLGKGTQCLVFTEPDAPTPRYLDLMPGGRPGLLTGIDNGRGLRTEVSYASSTEYALADRRAGRPWSTHLPIPVQVVSTVTITDDTTGVSTSTSYRYRDGYYDIDEREFRGFGCVWQADTDAFRAFLAGPPGHWLEQREGLVPHVTVTWYHTGAPGQQLPDNRLADEWEPTAAARRTEGLRALRGKLLRSATYALDGIAESRFPYVVTDHAYRIRELDDAPTDTRGRAVTVALPGESLTQSIEREPVGTELWYPDPTYVASLPTAQPTPTQPPRLAHTVAIAINDWGQVETSLSAAYGRTDSAARPAQRRTQVTVSESRYANLTGGTRDYRLGAPLTEHQFEVLAAPEPASGSRYSRPDAIILAAAPVLPDDGSTPTTPARRKLAITRTRYWNDTATTELPDGVVGTRATVRRVLAAALTQRQLGLLTAELAVTTLAARGRYMAFADDDGEPLHWVASPIVQPDPSRFHQPVAFIDAFGLGTFVTYDATALLPIQTLITRARPSTATAARFEADPTAPTWNIVRAEYDYRLLLPQRVIDPHGVVDEASYDALGALQRHRRRGPAGEGAPAGEWDAEYTHHLDTWLTSRTPQWTEQRARENYTSGTRWQRTLSYFDGSGRPLLTKVEAEPGLAPYYETDGRIALSVDGVPLLRQTAPVRWIGTGRIVYDGKARPIAQYDPYFAPDERYEDEAVLATTGHPVFLRYDPIGRVVRTDFPDGSHDLAHHAPWSSTSWDRADTVLDSAWYQRASGAGASSDEQQAAAASAVHAATPSHTHLDARGQVVEIVEQNTARNLVSTIDYDGAGRTVAVTDPREVLLIRTRHDMLGNPLVRSSPDTGEQRFAYDAQGRVLQSWSGCTGWATGNPDFAIRIRTERDGFGRDRATWVLDRDAEQQTEMCRLAIGYGDDAPAYALPRYLLGRAHQIFDGAGLAETVVADFTGNTVHTRRRFLSDYEHEPDWSAVAVATPDADRSPVVGNTLEHIAAQTKTTFDALARPVVSISAEGSVTETNYHPGGLVASVYLTPRGGHRRAVLDRAIYDVMRRPELVGYGPAGGVAQLRTDYDEVTQRVTRIRATRPGETGPLQDLRFRYDVVGNLLGVHDTAQSTRFFRNTVVSADRDYTYDDLYRLTAATGRELAGTGHTTANNRRQPPVRNLPDPADLRAIVRYRETYQYDNSGNLTELKHGQQVPGGATWTRSLTPDTISNRIATTTVSGTVQGNDQLGHNRCGNLTQLGSRTFTWTGHAHPRRAVIDGNVTAYYHHAADGTRLRKVVVTGTTVSDHRVVDSAEFDTTEVGSKRTDAVETLRVTVGARVAVLAERATLADNITVNQTPVLRYQLGDQLDSIALELDDAGNPLTYEEYHPYGTTAYESAAPSAGISLKRYRFTAKERDNETGLSHHGDRYYIPWLGRWLSPDPAGLVDGGNRFAYCRGRPTTHADPTGRQATCSIADVRLQSSTDDASSASDVLDRSYETGMTGSSGDAGYSASGALPPQRSDASDSDPDALAAVLSAREIDEQFKPAAELSRTLADGILWIMSAGGVKSNAEMAKNYAEARSDPSMPEQGKPTPYTNEIVDDTAGASGQLSQMFANSLPRSGPARPLHYRPSELAAREKEIHGQIVERFGMTSPKQQNSFSVSVTQGNRGVPPIVTVTSENAYNAIANGEIPLRLGEELGSPIPSLEGHAVVHSEIQGVWDSEARGATGGHTSSSIYGCPRCGMGFAHDDFPGWTHMNLNPSHRYDLTPRSFFEPWVRAEVLEKLKIVSIRKK